MKETLFHRDQDDEDLDTKITRRVQRAARRQAKQEQLKRLHKAQVSVPEDRDGPGQWTDVSVSCVSDDPKAATTGGGETTTAGRERSDGGKSSERRSRYET